MLNHTSRLCEREHSINTSYYFDYTQSLLMCSYSSAITLD